MDEYRLCSIVDIGDPGAREFQIDADGTRAGIFVVRWGGAIYAYYNRCPHTGVTLNWLPDQFFDYDTQYLQCAMHGARFRPEDGLCVWGPCLGQALQPVALRQEEDVVYVTL